MIFHNLHLKLRLFSLFFPHRILIAIYFLSLIASHFISSIFSKKKKKDVKKSYSDQTLQTHPVNEWDSWLTYDFLLKLQKFYIFYVFDPFK